MRITALAQPEQNTQPSVWWTRTGIREQAVSQGKRWSWPSPGWAGEMGRRRILARLGWADDMGKELVLASSGWAGEISAWGKWVRTAGFTFFLVKGLALGSDDALHDWVTRSRRARRGSCISEGREQGFRFAFAISLRSRIGIAAS